MSSNEYSNRADARKELLKVRRSYEKITDDLLLKMGAKDFVKYNKSFNVNTVWTYGTNNDYYYVGADFRPNGDDFYNETRILNSKKQVNDEWRSIKLKEKLVKGDNYIRSVLVYLRVTDHKLILRDSLILMRGGDSQIENALLAYHEEVLGKNVKQALVKINARIKLAETQCQNVAEVDHVQLLKFTEKNILSGIRKEISSDVLGDEKHYKKRWEIQEKAEQEIMKINIKCRKDIKDFNDTAVNNHLKKLKFI